LRIGVGDDGRVTVYCHAGCDYGDIRAALVRRGIRTETLRPAAAQTRRKQKRSVPKKKRRRQPKAKPLPYDDDVAKWHTHLRRSEQLGPARNYLRTLRGLSTSTILRYEIGHRYGRYVIPVRDAEGLLVNVRKYDPEATSDKMTSWPGHGGSVLYPLEALTEADLSEAVLLCEGEWDALLAGQYGLVAVTGTGGASAPPSDLDALRDRRVYIAYDCDDAGRSGAHKVAALLNEVAKEVFVVDLGLGLGEDITDWFVTHEKTADDLLALMAAAEPWIEEDEDEGELFVTLADLEETRLRWLWAGRIPAGKLTMLEGDPGLGKSMLWAKLVAHITTGEPLPGDGEVHDPADVLVVCAEDDLHDTIAPRLRAAGADLRRVHSVTLARDDKGHLIPLSIPEDLPRLRKAIVTARASLIVFDPVIAYLSETINSGNDASVRRALTPLAEIAQTTGAAVVMIRHLNKQGDLKALYRGGGSIAFIGAARSGLVVDRHPEQEGVVVLAQTKSNLARGVPALAYSVDSWAEDPTIPVVTWGDELNITAEQLLHKPDGRTDAPTRDAAVTFLRELLADGPVAAKEVQKAAREAGIAWRTVERAKERAVARTRAAHSDTGVIKGWEWFIPRLHIVREDDE
jgi:hypothetical protein